MRKGELVKAALDIIASRGIKALGTRALAEHVGMSSGAIFKHFPTLDALLEAVVEHVAAVLGATFPDPALPPRERLLAFVERRSQAVGERAGLMRLMMSEQFVLALPTGASERLAGCVADTRRFVQACIAEGQAQGAFRSDLPAAHLGLVAMGVVQMMARSQANGDIPAEATEGLGATLDTLLAPPGAGTNTGRGPRSKPR